MSTYVLESAAEAVIKEQKENTAKQYSLFHSVEDMDRRIRQFVTANPYLPKKILNVLEIISRYSLKAIGVSWLSAPALAKILGVSDDTIRRIIKKLEQLGIIKRHTCTRPDGGNDTPFISIQPDAEGVAEGGAEGVAETKSLESPEISKTEGGVRIEKSADPKRDLLFYQQAVENQIPKRLAIKIYGAIKDKRWSWISLATAFSKLRKNKDAVGNAVSWFTETLEREEAWNQQEIQTKLKAGKRTYAAPRATTYNEPNFIQPYDFIR